MNDVRPGQKVVLGNTMACMVHKAMQKRYGKVMEHCDQGREAA